MLTVPTPNKKHIAIILNHNQFVDPELDERYGTESDVKNLESILPDLHYDCHVFNDLTKEEIFKLPGELIRHNSEYLQKSESLLVVILTHGCIEGRVSAYDAYYDLNEFIENFHPKQFQAMADKPKIFFVSSCRGITPTQTTPIGVGNLGTDCEKSEILKNGFNLYENAVIIFGTNETDVAFRDYNYGTFFVQESAAMLFNFIRDYDAKKLEITDFFTSMNNNLIKREYLGDGGNIEKQIGQMLNSLVKPFYFTKG